MTPVIKVENLGKQYLLRHQAQEHYATLRDALANKARRWLRGGAGGDRPRRELFWALKAVDFTVEQGESVGIIGRNGAGKSTLLKLLSRITEPTAGRITLQGRVASLLEVGTGFHPELTGRENVYLNGVILGMKRAEIDRKFDEIVAFAEVEQFLDTPVKRYSSGMYVRLGFAVAAHLEVEILVVDEVLAVGDIAFQQKCLRKMDDMAGSGRTVLFVSHNMSAMKKLCSRAILLRSGEIAKIGEADAVVEAYLDSLSLAPAESGHLPPGFLYYRDPRHCAGDFCITGIQLLDRHERPLNHVATWDYVRFRIVFFAKRPVARGAVEWKIQTREGVTLILCATEPESNLPYSIVEGESYVDCVFPNFPLSEGSYTIAGGLAIPFVEWLCWHDQLAVLPVQACDIFNSGFPPLSSRFLVAAPHFWVLPQKGRRPAAAVPQTRMEAGQPR